MAPHAPRAYTPLMLLNPASSDVAERQARGATAVRHLRQVLLWPLRLLPQERGNGEPRPPWQLLSEMGERSPWREVVDEYTGERDRFHERHYNEFISFLPVVQRFLYGEGRSRRDSDDEHGPSPMRGFRRRDIAGLRVSTRPGDAPIVLDVVHVDLYFFYDVDVAILNVEVCADKLTLSQAQELLYRFGRAYPAGWDAQGRALHCLDSLEWLARDGRVLARSDAQQREGFLAHVCEHRAPRVATDWAFVLEPPVSHHSDDDGPLRFLKIENPRLP